jgi:hypothetical protein
MRPKAKAALRFIRDRRREWKDYIDRVLNIVEGAPLFSGEPSNQEQEVEGAMIANKGRG